jgi:hypothetical protein
MAASMAPPASKTTLIRGSFLWMNAFRPFRQHGNGQERHGDRAMNDVETPSETALAIHITQDAAEVAMLERPGMYPALYRDLMLSPCARDP